MYTLIIIKNFIFLFTVYRNERKEHKFEQQKYIKKATSTIQTKKYLILMILMLIKN